MNKTLAIVLAVTLALLLGTGCSTAPKTQSGKIEIQNDSDAAISKAKRIDPSMIEVFNSARGYAVFPAIGKGGMTVGGAYGKGVLYENDRAVGYCDLSQATVGWQLGGQSYTEIIFFETSGAVNSFKAGNFAFDAQASAVALKAGVGVSVPYRNGVAVYTMDEAGLMYEATIGGQKFSYQPK